MLRFRRVVLSAVLGAGLVVGALVDPAAAAPVVTGPTVNSTYTVRAGDYLVGIALKLNVKVGDLLAANDLQLTSLIVPGMRLTVPGTAPRTATAPAAKPSSAAQYVVVEGDYLSGIASKLGVSTRALLAANGLHLNSLIYPGMRLVVPKGGSLPSQGSTRPTSSQGSSLRYTIVAGDSLSGIAGKLGVSLTSLLTTNQLTTSSMIHPGMQLIVPKGGKAPASPAAPAAGASGGAASGAKYVVVSGDSLGGIAGKLGVSLEALLRTNKLKVTSLILPGMPLAVPKGGRVPAGTSSGPAVSGRIAKVLGFARAQIGKPYKFNAAGPNSYDCSGLTLAAYATIGVSLPHYSGAQMSFGKVIDWTSEPIRPGDLIFLETSPGSGVIGHVGIATGQNTYIHAPRAGDVVRSGTFGTTRLVGVRRLVND